jgi:hypothetical protein
MFQWFAFNNGPQVPINDQTIERGQTLLGTQVETPGT